MATAVLQISGMTCNHCAHTVERTLEGVDGVERARVDLRAGNAVVEYDEARTDPTELADAVSGEGYPARPG
jgi:copper chaperone